MPENDGTEPEKCPICLEEVIPKSQAFLTSACGHCFHYQCIRPWADRGSCPSCRNRLWLGDDEAHLPVDPARNAPTSWSGSTTNVVTVPPRRYYRLFRQSPAPTHSSEALPSGVHDLPAYLTETSGYGSVESDWGTVSAAGSSMRALPSGVHDLPAYLTETTGYGSVESDWGAGSAVAAWAEPPLQHGGQWYGQNQSGNSVPFVSANAHLTQRPVDVPSRGTDLQNRGIDFPLPEPRNTYHHGSGQQYHRPQEQQQRQWQPQHQYLRRQHLQHQQVQDRLGVFSQGNPRGGAMPFPGERS